EQYGDVAGTVLDGSFYADPNGLSDLTVAACAPIGLGLSWPPSGRPRPITSDRRAAARACVRVGGYGARPGADDRRPVGHGIRPARPGRSGSGNYRHPRTDQYTIQHDNGPDRLLSDPRCPCRWPL